MNEYDYINNAIALEAKYDEGYEAGKQAAIEQIFADIDSAMRLSKTTHVGQQFYGPVLETYINNIKKKYGVEVLIWT